MGRTSVVEAEKKGKELVRSSETEKSACHGCAFQNTKDKLCPINHIPIGFHLLIWVSECGSRKTMFVPWAKLKCGRPCPKCKGKVKDGKAGICEKQDGHGILHRCGRCGEEFVVTGA